MTYRTSRAILAASVFVIGLFAPAQPTGKAARKPEASVVTTTDTMTILRTIQKDVESLKERRRSIWDADVLAPLLSTVVIAALGWFFTWRVTRYSIVRSGTLATEERLFETLKLFTEGTQARGLAISAIEAYWDKLPWFQPAWSAALANQAIHLLTRTKERTSRVEQDNATRILDLLARRYDPEARAGKLRHDAPYAYECLSRSQQRSIRDAVLTALSPEVQKRGVKIPDAAAEWWLYVNRIPDDARDDYRKGRRAFADLGVS